MADKEKYLIKIQGKLIEVSEDVCDVKKDSILRR